MCSSEMSAFAHGVITIIEGNDQFLLIKLMKMVMVVCKKKDLGKVFTNAFFRFNRFKNDLFYLSIYCSRSRSE